MATYVLNLSCPDRSGLIHAITGTLLGAGANIVEQAQFTDPDTQTFFVRTTFETEAPDVAHLRTSIAGGLDALGGEWRVWAADEPQRVLVMVSQADHCLVDLLYRMDIGELSVTVPLVVSNHADCREIAERHGADFVHLPITADTKNDQEQRLLALVDEYRIDVVVLARYMQVLTAQICDALPGRIINIHHSFLPGFKGANPYGQAYDRGVKLIGATAHFVTTDLDEGPIIEQDVERVNHALSPTALAAIGRDIERVVLARALRLFAEHRIFLNGHRTVVFT